MSHYIPSYYRYVSQLTIDNAGSGYSSEPTLTFSGGGGTGATGTAEVYSGEIVGVKVTNPGTGYTSSPTVTISGGGGTGASITAKLSFATDSSTEYNEKHSLLLDEQFPEYITSRYPKFILFLKKYYEWMETEGPAKFLLNEHINNIDSASEAFLNKWQKYLGIDVPKLLAVEKSALLKRLKDVYETKGSKRSIEMFFRIVYNEEVEVYYPQHYLLRPSDGQWVVEKSIKITAITGGPDPLTLPGKVVGVHYYATTGTITTVKEISATVERVEKIAYTSPQAYEVYLNLADTVTKIEGPGTGATFNITLTAGVVTDVEVTNGGSEYIAAPSLTVGDPTGTGATVRANVSGGAITSVTITDGGSGYTDPTMIVDTDGIQSHIAIGSHASMVRYGNLQRTLLSVTTNSVTYTSDSGFRVGDTFEVNETGDDGRGYSLTYFEQDYVLIGGRNGAYVKILEVDPNNYNAPLVWEVISGGTGFLNTTTTLNLTSKNGTVVPVTITSGYLLTYAGKYIDDKGKLSNVNVLQDNKKWQKYSYVVKTGTSQTVWEGPFKDFVHPAGLEVFSDLIIKHNLDFASNISVAITGTVFRKFITTTALADTHLVELDYRKNLTELLTVTDVDFFSYAMNKQEVAVVTEEHAKNLTLVKADTASISQVFDRVLTYIREPSDTVFNSDDQVLSVTLNKEEDLNASETNIKEFNKPIDSSASLTDADAKLLNKPLSETLTVLQSFESLITFIREFTETLTASDTDIIAYNKNVIDSSVLTDAIDSFDVNKAISDTPLATESDAKVISKPVADTGTVSDAPVKNVTQSIEGFGPDGLGDDVSIDEELNFAIQGYVDGNYFLEDYVGTYFTVINKQKSVANDVFATDNTNLQTTNIQEESVSITDSGIVVKENYSSEGYFGGDYVGTGTPIT
jgi:hypothetical protein